MPSPESSKRLSVIEYGRFLRFDDAATHLGIPTPTLLRYIDETSERIFNAVGVNQPFEFSRDRFRVVDVAGLIRLGPYIHLEVCPKFLAGTESPEWREDFFAIANLVRFGRILPWEQLHAGLGEKGDLADLIAYAIVSMYDDHRRRPLRLYKPRTWQDFDVDGEVEPESIFFPGDRGFSQSGILLDRRNDFNEIIHHAMGLLLPELHDRDVRHQLAQRYIDLAPQNSARKPRHIRNTLPHRHRRWQELFDLSREVIDGFGVVFEDTFKSTLPGFIIRTSDAWESLVFRAVLSGMRDRLVRKSSYGFAVIQTPQGKQSSKVTPDVSICRSGDKIFVVDAKYKTRMLPDGKEHLDIQAADVYEALAFMRAAETDKIVLIYPAPFAKVSASSVGATAVFERVTVGSQQITGLTLDPRSISKTGGFQNFSARLSQTLREDGA